MKPIDSNIQGMDTIPSHWQIKELKYCLLPGSEGIKIGPFGSALKSEMLVEEGYKVYGQENLIKDDFSLGHRFISEEKFNELAVYEISENDVLISMMGTVGKCKVVPSNIQKGIMDSHLIRIRFNENLILPEFASYLIQDSEYIKVQIDLNSKGSIMSGLNSSIIKNLKLILPTIKEQEIILEYMDIKDNSLNRLLTSKYTLLELLEQQRQSIITEAVTKGLNSNVRMKDSGVEWIGEIPEHWNITKVKYTSYLLNGDRGENYPSGNDFLDEGIPFITSHNLNKRYIDYSYCKYISDERYKLLRGIKIKNKDIIYCLRGSVGKNAMATQSKGTIASSLMGIRAKTNINAEFLLYVLNSKVEVWNRSLLTTGSVSDNLSAENVGSYIIPHPNLDEQERIVSYLTENLNELDKLSVKVENQIEKLKEYRQALIYEAVTGKIDVRDMEFD